MRRLVLFCALLLLLLPAEAAAVETFPVTNTNDHGPGSLRAALEAADEPSVNLDDEIPIETSGTIELETELPPIIENTVITGPGPQQLTVLRKSSAPGFRIFETGPMSVVSISGMTISGGVAQYGAGILGGNELALTGVVLSHNEATSSGGVNSNANGGGVFGTGKLVILDSVIRENRAVALGGENQTVATAGGIAAAPSAEVLIERSTVAGNLAEADSEGEPSALAFGGGVAFEDGKIVASTISGNVARATGSPTLNNSSGGGAYGSWVEVTGSTVARNSAAGSGANLALSFEALARDTIVAEPLGGAESCSPEIPSGGFNLDEDGSCKFVKPTDLSEVIAGLEPLANNGGPTPTHALAASSPAIDRGSSFGLPIDQRGLPRPSDFVSISNSEGGDGSDIGAFELQAPARPAGGGPAVVSEQPADVTPPNTRIVSGPARNTYKTKAEFRFASTEAQSSFQCRLDKKPWRGCANPFKRTIKPGRHIFKVRAIDRFGNVDPSPARFGWRVKPLS